MINILKSGVLHHENKRTKTRERKQESENKRVKLETYFLNISHKKNINFLILLIILNIQIILQ